MVAPPRAALGVLLLGGGVGLAHLWGDEDEDAAMERLGLVIHWRVDLHQVLKLLAGGAALELLGQR
jgi:hypothetical protein